MDDTFLAHLREQSRELEAAGFLKRERVLASPQDAAVLLDDGRQVINFCANNYLGLANDEALRRVARRALDEHGFGMASVRFICGTQTPHRQLENGLAAFLGVDDAILYSSCFDANGGLFETLFDERDAVISDALNHASIIDGIRLCKARRLRYANNDMADLDRCLREAADSRFRLVVTDGVFSMDGVIADLRGICGLAERHRALVMVDDSHAVGVLGPGGRGTAEYCGVEGRVDILTGTLGKALGGASGGYTAGRREIVAWLRQRSRPYLFSNSLAPAIAAASVAVLDRLAAGGEARRRLHGNAAWFRARLEELGFTLAGAGHPIVPVMIGDAHAAGRMAERLLEEGVYVIAFSYPVVPKGQARIRVQLSAAHTRDQLEQAAAAFARVGRELGLLPKEARS